MAAIDCAGRLWARKASGVTLHATVGAAARFGMVMERVQKSDAEWREQLEPDRYAILRRAATEPAFSGALYRNDEDGSYRCAGCGADVFSSETKFESGSGWPSFSEPATAGRVTLVADRSHGMVRTEVRCAACESHLGHVFDDGPQPGGMRYCINSLALEFSPGEGSSPG